MALIVGFSLTLVSCGPDDDDDPVPEPEPNPKPESAKPKSDGISAGE